MTGRNLVYAGLLSVLVLSGCSGDGNSGKDDEKNISRQAGARMARQIQEPLAKAEAAAAAAEKRNRMFEENQ